MRRGGKGVKKPKILRMSLVEAPERRTGTAAVVHLSAALPPPPFAAVAGILYYLDSFCPGNGSAPEAATTIVFEESEENTSAMGSKSAALLRSFHKNIVFFDPLSLCSHLELFYTIKFMRPPNYVCFSMTPSPSYAYITSGGPLRGI